MLYTCDLLSRSTHDLTALWSKPTTSRIHLVDLDLMTESHLHPFPAPFFYTNYEQTTCYDCQKSPPVLKNHLSLSGFLKSEFVDSCPIRIKLASTTVTTYYAYDQSLVVAITPDPQTRLTPRQVTVCDLVDEHGKLKPKVNLAVANIYNHVKFYIYQHVYNAIPKTNRVILTGYKLGGAVAQLLAMLLERYIPGIHIGIITFGTPPYCDRVFLNQYHQMITDTCDLIAADDLVLHQTQYGVRNHLAVVLRRPTKSPNRYSVDLHEYQELIANNETVISETLAKWS
jgi:hypothetical protein